MSFTNYVGGVTEEELRNADKPLEPLQQEELVRDNVVVMDDEMIEEAKHDSRRVEYVRGLIEENGPMTAIEAYKVESFLGGIMAKHLIRSPVHSFENYCGGVGTAIGVCDHVLATLNNRIRG